MLLSTSCPPGWVGRHWMARLIRSRDLPEGKARSPGSAAPTVASAAPRLRMIDHAPSPVGAGGAWPVVPSAVMRRPWSTAKGAPESPPLGRASRSSFTSGRPVCSGGNLRASTSAAHSSVARWPSDPGPMKLNPHEDQATTDSDAYRSLTGSVRHRADPFPPLPSPFDAPPGCSWFGSRPFSTFTRLTVRPPPPS